MNKTVPASPELLDQVLNELCTLWPSHKSSQFFSEIVRTFNPSPIIQPPFDCFFVAECAEACFETCQLSTWFSKMWTISDAGINRIANAILPTEQSDDRFSDVAMIRFATRERDVIVNETYGGGFGIG